MGCLGAGQPPQSVQVEERLHVGEARGCSQRHPKQLTLDYVSRNQSVNHDREDERRVVERERGLDDDHSDQGFLLHARVISLSHLDPLFFFSPFRLGLSFLLYICCLAHHVIDPWWGLS